MLDARTIIIRILLSTFLGALIGVEREVQRRPAGIRTHILVTLGSTLVMLISIDAFEYLETSASYDPARIAAQVISGIGFLGAGTILKMGNNIVGLTTAASLWVSAAIGLAIGVGYFMPGILVAIIVFVTLLLSSAMDRYTALGRQKTIRMVLAPNGKGPEEIESFLSNMGVQIKHVDMTKDNGEIHLVFTVRLPRDIPYGYFYRELYSIPQVSSIEVDRN